MAVALVDRGIGSQAIEVAGALGVINPDAFSTLEHHIKRMIVVSAIPFLELNVLGSVHVEIPCRKM
jgi:hypothetical protein